MPLKDQPHASWAEVYDIAYQLSFGEFYTQLTDATVNLIVGVIPPPAKIIDFGAGTGRLSIPLSRKGYSVTAIEPCQEMLFQLKSKDPDATITPVCTKMEDYCGNDEFDLALCVFTVILYLLDQQTLKKALHSAYGAIRPGGMLFLDIPSESIFRGYSRQSPFLDRTVTVTHQDGSIYHYQEVVNIKRNDQEQTRYVDEFPIRHWSVSQVSDVLKELGFVRHKDLTNHFFGTGSNYYIYQKPNKAVNGSRR